METNDNAFNDINGEIPSPMFKNKWRLSHWGKLTADQIRILTLQAIKFSVSNVTTLMEDGKFSIEFEHDVDGNVFARIQELPSIGNVHIEMVDGDGVSLIHIILYDVIVTHHYFDANYAECETFKSMLSCSFRGMKAYGSKFEWSDKLDSNVSYG